MIPELTIQTIKDYVDHGVPPGDFVRAVLENDLSQSFGRADRGNREAMFEIVSYVYNHVPIRAWGSKQWVDQWLMDKKEERAKKANNEQ